MSDTRLYDEKIKVLHQEWAHTQNSIRGLDEIVFKIRGWSITLTAAVLGYAYVHERPELCAHMSVLIIIFWIVDGLFKSFQRRFIKRDREIRDYFASSMFEDDIKSNDIKGIAIAKAFAAKESKRGWTAAGIKRQTDAMLLRNVVVSYVPLIAISAMTFIQIITR